MKIAAKKTIKRITLGITLSLLSGSLYADVSGDLNNYFSGLGFNSNTTSPTVVQGQEANYFSGGSLFLRNPVKNMQLVQLQAPSLNAGCGGIDMFGGAFSFINSDQIVTFGKSMLQASPGVAFNLAMQTFSPTLSHDYEAFQNFMNQMNNFNLNSCTADYALAGAATKALGNNQYACKDLGSQGGQFADWAAAAVGCENPQAVRQASNTAQGKMEMTVNANVVWNALQAQPMYAADKQLAEFMMSVSGSVLFDENGKATALPALAEDPGIFNALLYGGQDATIYDCKDAGCLDVGTTTVQLSTATTGLINQVSTYINGIQTAIQNDTPLTPEQQSFLSAIPEPVFTYMTTSVESGMNVDFNQFSDAIAYMVLIHYMLATEKVIQDSVTNLTNYDSDTINGIVANINTNVRTLNGQLATAQQALSNQMQLNANFAEAQKRVVGKFSNNMQSNLNFTGM